MSINNSLYGPSQYFYPLPVNGSTPPVSSPPPQPSVQVADTAVFTPQTPPKNTISIGKAAKYGAGITAGSVLIGTGMNIFQKRHQLLKVVDKTTLLARTSARMAAIIAEGSLSGALVGYFLKRSQKQDD